MRFTAPNLYRLWALCVRANYMFTLCKLKLLVFIKTRWDFHTKPKLAPEMERPDNKCDVTPNGGARPWCAPERRGQTPVREGPLAPAGQNGGAEPQCAKDCSRLRAGTEELDPGARGFFCACGPEGNESPSLKYSNRKYILLNILKDKYRLHIWHQPN